MIKNSMLEWNNMIENQEPNSKATEGNEYVKGLRLTVKLTQL